MRPKKILIAADNNPDSVLIDTLQKKFGMAVETAFISSIDYDRTLVLKRHFSYVRLALRSFFRRADYSYIIFWQQFIGLYFCLFASLSPRKKDRPFMVTMPFIYKKRDGFIGLLHRWLFLNALNSPLADRFICHSSGEYGMLKNEFGAVAAAKVRFVEHGIKSPLLRAEEDIPHGRERYFFSGGTSNRDYKTLISAFEGLDDRLKIACYRGDIKDIRIPPNVEIIIGCSVDAFAEIMKAASAVIITLDKPEISSGHLVALDAMRLGKAIIATRGNCIKDYLDDKCSILVRDHSVGDIRSAVVMLKSDKETASRLSLNAREKYEKFFTMEKYGQRIAAVMKDIT